MNIKNVEQLEIAKKQVKDFNDTIEKLQVELPTSPTLLQRAEIDSLVYQRNELIQQINCAESFMESCTVMMENKLLKQKINELQEALNRAPSIERNKNLRQMNRMIVTMENLKDALWNLFVMCGKHPTILKIAHKEVTEAGRVLLKYNENTFITLEESRDNRTQKSKQL